MSLQIDEVACMKMREGMSYKPNSMWRIDVVMENGRWQDNEPLMRALSKLINLNEPDLVLFVGEALVGNDGVDQLTKFNQVSLCTLLHNAQSM